VTLKTAEIQGKDEEGMIRKGSEKTEKECCSRETTEYLKHVVTKNLHMELTERMRLERGRTHEKEG